MFRTCISFAALVYLSSWALYGIVMFWDGKRREK